MTASTQRSQRGRLQTLHVETFHPLRLLGMLGILAARGSCWAGEVGIPRPGRQLGHGDRPGSCGLPPCSVPAGSPVPAVQLRASWSDPPRAGDSWRSRQGEEPGCWKRIWQASDLLLLNAIGAGGEGLGRSSSCKPHGVRMQALGLAATAHPCFCLPRRTKKGVGAGDTATGAGRSQGINSSGQARCVPSCAWGLCSPGAAACLLGLVSDLSPFPGRNENK